MMKRQVTGIPAEDLKAAARLFAGAKAAATVHAMGETGRPAHVVLPANIPEYKVCAVKLKKMV
ncbi:MAG TPA: hypothetical protein VMU10_06935 [Desulfomonilia bacterium]|nr:hypothetical protein [Desulfomonilia bacterium]